MSNEDSQGVQERGFGGGGRLPKRWPRRFPLHSLFASAETRQQARAFLFDPEEMGRFAVEVRGIAARKLGVEELGPNNRYCEDVNK